MKNGLYQLEASQPAEESDAEVDDPRKDPMFRRTGRVMALLFIIARVFPRFKDDPAAKVFADPRHNVCDEREDEEVGVDGGAAGAAGEVFPFPPGCGDPEALKRSFEGEG